MPWKEIFESVSSISTWLGLSGLLSAMFFFTVRLIAQKKIFKPLTRNASESLLRLIVWLSFALLVLSILMAAVAGTVEVIYTKPAPVKQQRVMRGTIELNGKGTPKIDIKLREILQSKVSNDFGDFEFKLDASQLRKSYTLEVSSELIQDSTFRLDSATFFSEPTLVVNPVQTPKEADEPDKLDPVIEETAQTPDDPVVQFVKLTGSVRDAAGNKLAGVGIRSTAGDSTLSDAIGEFELRVKQTPERETRLHFWHEEKVSSKQVAISSARITLQFQ